MNATMDSLQHRIQAALSDDADLHDHDHNIDVLDNNGVITLRGRVHSFAARERAEEIARGMSGVTSVINEIDVV